MEHLIMARDWAEVQAMISGTTPADELQRLAARNGMKWESMGREVGMCYQAVMAMCKRHGYVKPHCKAFEFRGKKATLTQHCKDHGILETTVSTMKWRFQPSGAAWAMEKCLELRDRRAKK